MENTKYIPTAGGRARGWWHYDVPSHSSKMTASRCVLLNTRQRAEEFGVPSHNYKTWKSGRVQEELNMIHYPRAAGLWHVYLLVCGRKSQMTLSRHIAVCLLAKDLMKLLYICTCVFLIYDIFEYVYPSACDQKFSVQLDPYLVQRKYKFRTYIYKLITIQCSLPYKVVLVSTSMVIVIVLLIQHVSL